MRISLSSLALLALVAGCTPNAGDPTAATAASPAGASEIVEVPDAETLVTSVAGLDKKAVVLNFWATWCGPCKAEFPTFVQFDRDHEGEDVEVRFVSVDDANALPDVRAFLDEHGVTEPSYLYTGQTDITSQLNPFVGGAIPITMVLDGDGIVQHTTVGLMSPAELEAQVGAVLRGDPPQG